MKGALGVLALIAGAVFMLVQFGGGLTARKPTNAPDIKAPSVNEAADRAKNAGNAGADQVSSWSTDTWQIIIVLVIAAAIVISWARFPAFKWMTVGVGIAILGFLILI